MPAFPVPPSSAWFTRSNRIRRGTSSTAVLLGCFLTIVSAQLAVADGFDAAPDPGELLADSDGGSTSVSRSHSSGGTDDLALLAQKSNNPLSDVWLLILQNDTTYFDGRLVDGHRALNSFKLQPVMPIPILGGKYNLIFRPVIQLISSPLDDKLGGLIGLNQGQVNADPSLLNLASDPYHRSTGIGDSVLFALVGPNRLDGFVWGVGATHIFPTASDDIFGQGKWQAGPAALALRLGKESGGLGLENWNIGALAQHWWSYGGESDRPSLTQTDIQYFINWKYNDVQLIGMTPNIRINWQAKGSERFSIPIGLGTIGMFKLGRMPVRWGVEVQYYIKQPENIGAKWNFKVFFAPIILNPFK